MLMKRRGGKGIVLIVRAPSGNLVWLEYVNGIAWSGAFGHTSTVGRVEFGKTG